MKNRELPFFYHPQEFRSRLQKISIMRNNQGNAIKICEHRFNRFFRSQIQMIGRLVHHDNIWMGKEHFRKGNLGSLSSRKGSDFLICFFWINEQCSEESHRFLKRNSRSNELFSNRRLKIHVFCYLRIKSNADFFVDSDIAIERFQLTKQGFEQSCFPNSVFSNDSDFHRFGNLQFTRQIY